MIQLSPIKTALVPKDSHAAQTISCRNYDEFLEESEITAILKESPSNFLRVKMPHCDDAMRAIAAKADSQACLAFAHDAFEELKASHWVRREHNVLAAYKIVNKETQNYQIGIVGMAKTGQIRTQDNPSGTIIRNEGVQDKKVVGRANIIRSTQAFVGVVNNSVKDTGREIEAFLLRIAASRAVDYEMTDENNFCHQVWLVTDSSDIDECVRLFRKEPCAYVADGNHRSAAACLCCATTSF